MEVKHYPDDFIGIDITGQNDGMVFLSQDFNTKYDVFLSNEGSNPGKLQNQGSFFGTTWNYFTASGNEKHINTTGNTDHFYYYHPDEGANARIKPDCDLTDNCNVPNNFTNIEGYTSTEPLCASEGEVPEEPITKDKLLELENLIGQLNLIDRLEDEERAYLENLMNQRKELFWLLAKGSYIAEDYIELESLLQAEGTKSAKKHLIGLKIEQEDYLTANAILDDYIVETLDDQYFKYIQSLNIRSLSENADLSTAEKEMLYSIVEEKVPSSAMAKSMLSLKNGDVFEPELPEIVHGMAQRSNGVDAVSSVLNADKDKTLFANDYAVFPNPAKETVNFVFQESSSPREIHVLNSLGEKVYYASVVNDISSIPVLNLGGEGVYVAIFWVDGKITSTKKFIVLK